MTSDETHLAAIRQRVKARDEYLEFCHASRSPVDEDRVYLLAQLDAQAQTIATLRQERDEAISLSKQATNGWAFYAKRNIEHDDIARLHREIEALLSDAETP